MNSFLRAQIQISRLLRMYAEYRADSHVFALIGIRDVRDELRLVWREFMGLGSQTDKNL
jgi:hypothetical protein